MTFDIFFPVEKTPFFAMKNMQDTSHHFGKVLLFMGNFVTILSIGASGKTSAVH